MHSRYLISLISDRFFDFSLKLAIFLFFLQSSSVYAKAVLNYDHDAVCDFMFARLFEIESEIREGNIQNNSIIINETKGSKTLKFTSTSIDLIYIMTDNIIYIDDFSIHDERVIPYSNPKRLAHRFGTPNLADKDMKLGCDTYDMSLTLTRNEIQKIQIMRLLHE